MELFDYLEKIYQCGNYHCSLEDFILMWLDENFICNDSIQEEVVEGEYVGTHTRRCEINVDERTIKIFIDSEIW